MRCAAHEPSRTSHIGPWRAGCTTGIPIAPLSAALGAPTEAIFERSPFLKEFRAMHLAHTSTHKRREKKYLPPPHRPASLMCAFFARVCVQIYRCQGSPSSRSFVSGAKTSTATDYTSPVLRYVCCVGLVAPPGPPHLNLSLHPDLGPLWLCPDILAL